MIDMTGATVRAVAFVVFVEIFVSDSGVRFALPCATQNERGAA